MASFFEDIKVSGWPELFLAFVVAVFSSFGVLFIGEVMGQAPCVLCWYQRVFMFSLGVLLAIASYTSDGGVWRYALPLAAIGWVFAAYHTALYFELIPQAIEPCSLGPSCTSSEMAILGAIPIPLLSLTAFSAIFILLMLVRKRNTA